MSVNILERVIVRATLRQEEYNKISSDYSTSITEFNKNYDNIKDRKKRNALVVDVHRMRVLEAERKNIDTHALYVIDYNDSEFCSTIWDHGRKMAKMEKELCGICMETHTIRHLIRTTCGHIFGKYCFSTLVEYHYKRGDDVLHCPMCRSTDYDLLRYKILQTKKNN